MASRLFLLIALPSLLACKHSVQTPTKNPPEITLLEPAANQHFMHGDTIRITGSVTGTLTLTEVAVHLIDVPTNSEFFHNHFSPSSVQFYNFSAAYPVTDTRITSFKLQVEAVNSNGDNALKEVFVTIN